jgi:hypothetical protein
MQCPTQLYTASARPYLGIPEPYYPFHDKTVVVTCCGRLCLHRKKIHLSKSLAGQAVSIKEVEDGIWLISFMEYDLGYLDLEEKTLQPSTLRAKSATYVLGTICYPCVRFGQSFGSTRERGLIETSGTVKPSGLTSFCQRREVPVR